MPTPSAPCGPVRLPLPGWVEPAVAFRAIAAVHPHLAWQDRSRAGSARRSVIAVPGAAVAPLVLPADPAEDALDGLLRDLRAGLPDEPVASGVLGWWGWFGYELGAAALGLRSDPGRESGVRSPAAAFLLATSGVEADHDARTTVVVATAEEDARRLVALLLPLVGRPEPVPPPAAPAEAVWRHERAAYLRRIERARRSIAAGDAYQLCLTNRVDVRLRAAPDPLDVYLRLRAAAPVSAGGVVRIDGWTLVSASPETFLAVDAAGTAVSRPIKGTRPRSTDAAEDARLAEELRTSEKERAENLMIVDLVRNDLARVSRVGSVEVTGLFAVESFPAVHQLVSTVRSRVQGDPLDAVGALFPAGSMTGAPKRSAMRLLQALEEGPRGVYAGAWGRIGSDGVVDLAVVIRSIVLRGAEAAVGTGGGITILSEPAAEWDEIRLKARPLLQALGAPAP